MNHFVYFLRKTLLQGVFKFLACVILLLFFSASLFAGNYTWNGTTNSDWGTASNWSHGIIPGTNDTITINSGKPNLELDQDRTVIQIIHNGSTIDLDTNVLHVTQRATFNGGDVMGDTVKLRGALVYFQGTDFNCTLDVIVGQIKFSGGTFDQKGTFEQNGGASGWGEGGCVFNDSVTIKCSGATYLRMGQNTGDIFNAPATFISTGVYSIQIAYGDTSFFNDNVFINCTGNGGLSFCSGSNAAAIIAPGKKITAGSSGLTAGVIHIKGIVQSDTTSQSIVSTGTSTLNISSCYFTGNSTFSAPSILVKYSTFNSNSSFTKTGNAANQWEGGNVFNGTTTISNNTTGSGILRMALQAGDVYAGDVTFNTSTGYIQVAFADTSTFGGDVTTNNSKVGFSSGSGLLQFNGGEDQALTTAAIISAQKFILTKPGGLLTTNRQITIDSVLTLNGGVLSTDSLITLKAPAIVNGGSNVSHIDGPVKKIGNTAFVFPVGDQGQWNPIEISAPTQTTDAFTARFYLEGQPYGSAADTTIRLLNTCSYWNLTRTTGSSNVYVSLYWDSIACGLFDTTGLVVAAWNGSTWKNVEKEGITGSVMSGKIKSFTLTNYYASFTWGYKPGPGQPRVINIQPVLNISSSDPSWNHPISEDYFGYNGSSVLDEGQYWSDLSSNAVLLHNGISSIRHNGGTNGNYWDWRTGWFIPENELPNDWFYLKRSHKKTFPDLLPDETFVNEMQYFKICNDAVAGRPIFQFNNLTSGFNYELASLYRAHELNLPVKYVELGNEFYLNDEQYKEIYPSSLDYINYAKSFTDALKSIVPFADVQVAVVGSSSSENSAGRRSLWLETILSKIQNVTNRPDAITIHEYYTSGLNEPVNVNLGAYNIGKMFIKPFVKGDDLIANELQAVEDRSSALGLNPPLEVWLTEYNMNDDVSNNVGTWAHGLFNAIQTLKYLESPLITHLSSHAMTSDAVYGNIFESDRGFQNLAEGQLPENVKLVGAGNFETTQYGFTASGAAQNEIALAMKGANVIAHKIDFSPDATDILTIKYFENGVETYSNILNLYGWSFEKEEGFEAIIVNLGDLEYNIQDACSLGIFSTSSNCPQSMVQLKAIDPTVGIGSIGLLPIGSPLPDKLVTTGEINIATPNQVLIPPHSLTRIIYRNPATVTVRLTDNEICEGTQTSVLVQGGTFGFPCTLNISGSTPIITSDSLFLVPNNLTAEPHTITAIVNGVTSDPVTLTVHPAISVEATGGPSEPCADIPEITLSANVTTSNQNSNLSHSYSYLWVPDGEITDNNPFQQSININNINMKTNAYQVFVYDGYCWASSNIIELDRGPVSVDLGEDFTVCDNDVNFELRALTTQSGLIDHGTFYYRLLQNGSEIKSAQISPDFSVQNLGIGPPYTYRVEVWSDNGVNSNQGCPQWDEITVNVVPCCSCSSAVELNPHAYIVSIEEVGTVYNVSHIEDLISAINGTTISTPTYDLLNKTVTISPGSTGTPTICINGEFWVKNFVYNLNNIDYPINTIIIQNCTLRLGEDARIRVRGLSKLILKGCLVESCSTSTMWDGLYVDIYDQAVTEPELEITEYVTTSTRTTIRDAKNALVLRRDSPFDINKCDFEDNYVDVLMEKYNKTNNSSKIFNCSFDFTAFNDPTFADHKRAAFELNDIESFTIGEAVNGSENIIENSLYGIYSNNSNFKLLNTEIHDILDDQTTSDLEGSCIASFSDFDFNDRLIEIGDGNASGENFFSNSENGITGAGDMNYEIKRNTFGNENDVSESILKYCISLDNNNSLNKEIQINNNNEFYDYTFGIAIFNPLGKVTIKGNDFFNGVYPNSPTGFEGIAINVNRITPAALWGSEISDNTIGEESDPGTVTPKQPRIGIRLSQINSVKVETNNIFFTHSIAPNQHHIGIWAENCSELRIADFNKIDNYFPNFQAVLASKVTGLRLNASPFSCTEQNIFTRMSIGMHITGNSMFNSLYKNEFAEFDQGVFLDNTFIGSSIGTQDPPGSGSGNVMRNKWTCSSCGSLTFNRITGTITSPLDWYHDAGSTSDPEFPDNSVSGGLFSEIELTGTVSDDSECLLPAFPLEEEDTGLPLTLRIRNETLGGIVTDSIRYPNGYHDEFRYTARQMAFGILKKNATLIVMDDDSDTSFVSFYNETLASNINKIDSLETLLSNKLFVEADTLLNHFTDTNTIEHNYKRVYRLYIKLQLYGDTSLTNSDWDELYAIAMLHPLTGGHAVYAARNILKLEVHDGELSSARLMQPRQEKTSNKLLLYPNPANQYVILKYSGNESISKVVILDITGREVLQVNNTDIIDTSVLTSGLYFVKANVEGKWFNGTFIISH